MKELEQLLVEEFQQKLDRDLPINERAFIKWLSMEQHRESNKVKKLPEPFKVS